MNYLQIEQNIKDDIYNFDNLDADRELEEHLMEVVKTHYGSLGLFHANRLLTMMTTDTVSSVFYDFGCNRYGGVTKWEGSQLLNWFRVIFPEND